MTNAPPLPPMCPRCGRDAPIVYRGVVPYCTACGALRAPLSGPSVNLAGKPSQVGGAVARVLGWLVLLFGAAIALGLGLLLYALAGPAAGLAIALPVALVALVLGVALVRSGGSLRRSGADRERSTREQALLALAAHRGAITAAEAAQVLGVGIAEADALLTDLAKRDPDRVAVDVDDQGVVWYRVGGVWGGAHVRVEPRARVAPVAPVAPVDGAPAADPFEEEAPAQPEAAEREAHARR
jgi:hypothetical protein